MTTETPLDIAHGAMMLNEEDPSRRMRFFERLADSELFLLLKSESDGETLDPAIEMIDGAPYVLEFDREERLTDFTGAPAPYGALSGRVIAQVLAGQGVGMALNLGVAPSAYLMPAPAVDWLAQTLAHAPDTIETRATRFDPPRDLPPALLEGLDTKLATAAGLADMAYLAAVTYDDGREGHLLGVIDAKPGAQPALAQALNEALTFSGLEGTQLDVAFFAADAPVTAQLARVGLRIDLPAPETESLNAPAAPGRDPKNPPILR